VSCLGNWVVKLATETGLNHGEVLCLSYFEFPSFIGNWQACIDLDTG
jgi:hypothetical protein